jgi:hypothetical protein
VGGFVLHAIGEDGGEALPELGEAGADLIFSFLADAGADFAQHVHEEFFA